MRLESMSIINMSRLLAFNVLFIALAGFTIAAPTEEPSLFTQLLKEHKEILPSEVVEAYKNLSGEEKTALKDVFKNYKDYKNEGELIAALKEKSPELGAKAEKLHAQLQKKIDGLSAKPKEFIEELIAGGKGLYARSVNGEKITKEEIKLLIQTQVVAYKELPTEAKDEIKSTFSSVAKFLEDDKVQSLIAKLLEKTNEEH
uniref:Fatty-acid and retinol-binding protein 1 n=1 Tax=Caenorhabditis tropicalis TaxID=1561998 RepID=A0A1I7U3Z9_9PELO